MFLGIDIGTSGVKGILTDDSFSILDKETVSLCVSRPNNLWSEQNPSDWWQAVLKVVDAFKERCPNLLSEVVAIGLAGQMHGAVLLDKNSEVIRPAILWNDGRSHEGCRAIELNEKKSRSITGNIAMPGFTAPKLLWVQKHEKENFSKISKVLLPKDYIRLCMSGEMVSEVSDASGTLWLNVKNRTWSNEMLEVCGLNQNHMPSLCEGTDVSGYLKSDLVERWGMQPNVILAGGAGDNAAGAVGIGAVENQQAFISLGTSGVYFVASNDYRSAPEKTVHSFCHALPNRWHQMGVILSAASCINSATQWLGVHNEGDLVSMVTPENFNIDLPVTFIPYLSGERTPHNNPKATGVFHGLTHATTRADIVQAVLEGVSFAFSDCQEALESSGHLTDSITLIGGGSRSRIWGELLASVLNKRIIYVADGDQGPAYGAAKLAALSYYPKNISSILNSQKVLHIEEPNAKWQENLFSRLKTYRSLYQQLKPLYQQ